jgi:hypothetical protein
LFLLCPEGLTSLITHEEEQGHLVGVKVCRGHRQFHIFLFADDSLILMRADVENTNSLRRAGELISEAKSSIFFSPSTRVEIMEEVCTTLNILTKAVTNKYLGLPPIVGVDRTDCFVHLIERVISKLNGWKEKIHSFGGKEVLLKAVTQDLHAYAMSVFKLPKQVCQGIISAMS